MKQISRTLILLTLMGTLFAQDLAPKNTILKSIILPGWGELSYKSNSAYVFLGTEAALWLGFAGLRYSGYVQNRDLISYTQLNAGISDYPSDIEYWSDLGNYMSYEDHEEDMLENRTPENIWNTDYRWEWSSEDKLLEYGTLFRKKELTLLGSEFLITGMIVNRIASVINVRYLNKNNMQISAYAGPMHDGGYLQIGLSF
ncbi:MAG: hypothetical protein J7M01_03360 [Candidatus Marinimicrobia bacterium]|nr:hypothetical protein [Candidatus Neomarinimicrobiota bacterium]